MPESLKDKTPIEVYEAVLKTAIKLPYSKVNRTSFLRKELSKYFSEETVEKAIEENPAKAGIGTDFINNLSLKVIRYETNRVSLVSMRASAPSSLPVGPQAMIPLAAGAATVDLGTLIGGMLRIAQKLAYLYGFEDFMLDKDELDSETMLELQLFLGVMFGVQGTAVILKKLADNMADKVARQLAQKALTKGMIYPIVKKIALAVGRRMNKQLFADTVASAIPLAGAAASGALTMFTFRPCCLRLRATLKGYNLCNPDFYKQED